MLPTRLSDVQQKTIDWIWEGRLARGMFTLLEADPGMGKGLISIDIAARLTRSAPMPPAPFLPSPSGRAAGEEGPPTSPSEPLLSQAGGARPPILDPPYLSREAYAFIRRAVLPLPEGVPEPPADLLTTLAQRQAPNSNDVLLCTTEDSRALTQKARAVAAGANLDRIYCLDSFLSWGYTGGMDAIKDMLDTLELTLCNTPVGLVIIDPLVGFLQALSVANEKDVRHTLAGLSAIAERRNCAILAVRHLNKSSGKSAIYRGSGTIAFAAVSRFVYCLGTDPDDPEQRIMACVKNNVSAHPPALAYRIVAAGSNEIESARVEWLGPTGHYADDLHQHRVGSGTAGRSMPSVRQQARDLLRQHLANGPLEEAALRKVAVAAGISRTTLRRAKEELGVCSTHQGRGRLARWVWSLPVTKPLAKGAQPGSRCSNTPI